MRVVHKHVCVRVRVYPIFNLACVCGRVCVTVCVCVCVQHVTGSLYVTGVLKIGKKNTRASLKDDQKKV